MGVVRTDNAMHARRSRLWSVVFRAGYAFLRITDPALRAAWMSGGLGITSRLEVAGRRTGRPRSVLVGLLRVNDRWYVGHPNGTAAWIANLAASPRARVWPGPNAPVDATATELAPGDERTRVIEATARQQPFPANLLYWAARRHILAVGRYFRLEPDGAELTVERPATTR